MKAAKKSPAKRRREALAKGAALDKRVRELEACVSEEQKSSLAAALAREFAALMEDYPDVFPAPPVSPAEMREHAAELDQAEEDVAAAGKTLH